MARRFVLRVDTDPARDPPVPDHPEALVSPTLRLVRETLADADVPVDYALQLTDARLVVDGDGVTEWAVGDRVAAGCCGSCDACRRGRFPHRERGSIAGVHEDGGYAEYTPP